MIDDSEDYKKTAAYQFRKLHEAGLEFANVILEPLTKAVDWLNKLLEAVNNALH